MTPWSDIARHIALATGVAFAPEPPKSVGGGCINEAYVLSDGARRFFVKLNAATRLSMFEAEAAGLAALAAPRVVRVPQPLCVGQAAGHAYLVLEYLPLDASTKRAAARLGEQLAALHRVVADRFGFERDNTIGSTPQPNGWSDDWVSFLREHRLGHQLRLAARRGLPPGVEEAGQRLLEALPAFFRDHRPEPSLLHGDLWGGNWAATPVGDPVIFDPATYYGDREADLAMTELFGGFPQDFYAAYRAAWPLDAGYAVRKNLYNLYHVLNHFNLFGGGYVTQAARMIAALLAEVR